MKYARTGTGTSSIHYSIHQQRQFKVSSKAKCFVTSYRSQIKNCNYSRHVLWRADQKMEFTQRASQAWNQVSKPTDNDKTDLFFFFLTIKLQRGLKGTWSWELQNNYRVIIKEFKLEYQWKGESLTFKCLAQLKLHHTNIVSEFEGFSLGCRTLNCSQFWQNKPCLLGGS